MGKTQAEYDADLDELRRQQRLAMLAAGVDEAKAAGYALMKRADVANRAGVSPGLLNYYFGTMADFRSEVMEHAVAHEILPVVRQGIAGQHPAALAAPEHLKAAALAV